MTQLDSRTLILKMAKAQFLVAKIIWSAITFSILVLCFVGYNIISFKTNKLSVAPSSFENYSQTFLFIALGLAVVAYILKLKILSREALDKILTTPLTPQQISFHQRSRQNPMPPELREHIDKVSLQDLAPLRTVMWHNPRMILLLVLHEAIAILGFVSVSISRDPQSIWAFAVIAMVLNLSIFPDSRKWLKS